jgi:hypothetical protein
MALVPRPSTSLEVSLVDGHVIKSKPCMLFFHGRKLRTAIAVVLVVAAALSVASVSGPAWNSAETFVLLGSAAINFRFENGLWQQCVSYRRGTTAAWSPPECGDISASCEVTGRHANIPKCSLFQASRAFAGVGAVVTTLAAVAWLAYSLTTSRNGGGASDAMRGGGYRLSTRLAAAGFVPSLAATVCFMAWEKTWTADAEAAQAEDGLTGGWFVRNSDAPGWRLQVAAASANLLLGVGLVLLRRSGDVVPPLEGGGGGGMAAPSAEVAAAGKKPAGTKAVGGYEMMGQDDNEYPGAILDSDL